MLLSLLALVALAVPANDDGLVAEFRRYYGKDRTPGERREAVLTLREADSRAAVEALLAALQDDDYLVRRAAVDVLSGYRAEECAAWLVENVLQSRKLSKDGQLVAATAEALGGMQHLLAFHPLVELLGSRDLLVRLGGTVGLGRLGSARAVEPLSRLLGDKEPAVAIAAVDALAAIGDGPAAEPAVLQALGHAHKPVRLAALSAVVSLRLKAGVRPLIDMADGDPDPRVREDALDSLQALTLRDFGDDPAAWRAWWDRNEARFELPDLQKIAEARAKLQREGGRYAKPVSFQQIETKSENILFVIDVSQSMEEPFGDLDRLTRTGRQYASTKRLEIVKEELIATIGSLSDATNFNIIAFATDVELWKKNAVRANVLNRNAAAEWVGKLSPKGSGGVTFRSRSGLPSSSANEGATNTHLALMTAFGEQLDSRGSNAFVTKVVDPIDTIFFLTDGEPTVGKTVDMHEIRQEVRRVNAYRGVQLHVIYVGAFGGKDFQKLAEENNGVFVSIGG